MKKILVTGGCGFVGSNIAIALKENFPSCDIISFDNLYRKGSELNVTRLEKAGVKFVRGDVRNPQEIEDAGSFDFLIECSAEPSVLAGKGGSADYLVQTNLYGAINCAEACRKNSAGMIFLSTSRVYPMHHLLNCEICESETRMDFSKHQKISGLSQEGVSEKFPMEGARSLYGATKYAAEIMLAEYSETYGFPVVINRCGVIGGPWQFGKADQGIAVFWLASHMFGKPLKYIGFGGKGRQVRDFLHIDDLVRLIMLQLKNPEKFAKTGFFNVGGGREVSASLLELTTVCHKITGNSLSIGSETETRYADIPVYVTDNGKISSFCGWKPKKNLEDIIEDIYKWLKSSCEAQNLLKS